MSTPITWKRLALGAFAAAAVMQPAYSQPGTASSKSERSIAITNVTVIDVRTGARQPGMTVLSRDGRIDAIGGKIAVPRNADGVDGTGKFLIPGLWDMHAHHQGNGAESVDLFVAKGVVGTRDMGADLDFIVPLRMRVDSGELLGPDIVFAGPMLDDTPPTFPYRRRVTNSAEAREAVRDLKRHGVDFIKVHDHTPREVFFAIADEAPKQGLTFAGHVPLAVTVEEAADAGIRSIEHLANYRVFDECTPGDHYDIADCARLFDKLAAKGVWQTPTMAFFQSIPSVFSGEPLPHAEYASDVLLEATRRNIGDSHLDAKALAVLRLAARISLEAIHDLRERGNRFLAGCDGLVPGFCLHDELEWLTRAGFSPLQALQTATINPALFLGREGSEGTVEVGKRANLVMLDADPLIDIRNTTRITAVVLRGKLLRDADLRRIVAAHKRPD